MQQAGDIARQGRRSQGRAQRRCDGDITAFQNTLRVRELRELMQGTCACGAAEVGEEVAGTSKSVPHFSVLPGHATGEIVQGVSLHGVNDVLLLCFGVPDHRYKVPVWLMEDGTEQRGSLSLVLPAPF
jgi:hypothetical protein